MFLEKEFGQKRVFWKKQLHLFFGGFWLHFIVAA